MIVTFLCCLCFTSRTASFSSILCCCFYKMKYIKILFETILTRFYHFAWWNISYLPFWLVKKFYNNKCTYAREVGAGGIAPLPVPFPKEGEGGKVPFLILLVFTSFHKLSVNFEPAFTILENTVFLYFITSW